MINNLLLLASAIYIYVDAMRTLKGFISSKILHLCFYSLGQQFYMLDLLIDRTELFIERPSSCRSQSITYSSYKNHNTAKGLIGISPSGYPSFVSSLYAGRTSDRKITKDCGILDLLEPNDQIMADRGFDIQDDLPNNVTLNIPPFWMVRTNCP